MTQTDDPDPKTCRKEKRTYLHIYRINANIHVRLINIVP